MTVKEILNITAHRPWKFPSRPWKYYQEWNNVIFVHWQVNFEDLRKFVPKGLKIDLFNGQPWVSMVAFTMENIRPKYLPSFSWISNFHEINIRTYVTHENKTGVYFLSIEGGTKISCKLAKGLSGLPYRYSKIKRQENNYSSLNSVYDEYFEITYQMGARIAEKTELDQWLTERYALFQDSNDAINVFEIHHTEWPINHIELIEITVSYPRFNNLIQHEPIISHYSTGVQVIAWDKQKIRFKN